MDENNKTNAEDKLMDNEHVKTLFVILQDNTKDTSGLAALINCVQDMETFVSKAENRLEDMKCQLDEMKEIIDHPIKSALQKTIKSLETKVATIKEQLSKLKTNIVEGCKNAVTAFKEKGISALDKLASFFRVKEGLQSVKNDTVKGVANCDKSIAKINNFSKEYHETGRHLKNMVRVLTGKPSINTAKESGKLAKLVSAPYRAEKACLLGIRNQVNKMITALDKLEQKAEAKRNERAEADTPKKLTLMERLEEKKNEIKERELTKPTPERALKPVGQTV